VTETLFAVAGNGDRFYAAGQFGLLVHGTLEETTWTTVIDGDIISLFWGFDDAFKGITRDGKVIEGRFDDEEITVCPVAEIPGPLEDCLFMSCRGEENFVVLTQDALMGAYECTHPTVV
jgi:hypothetical protein